MVYKDLLVIGGGPAGIFAALAAVDLQPGLRVLVLDRGNKPLAKVYISGGGRCNVTHACFDPAELVNFYPRGGKELRGPFTQFQPQDTVNWFEQHGVQLKTEADGRIFPASNRAETIASCLLQLAKTSNIEIRTHAAGKHLISNGIGFTLTTQNGEIYSARKVIIAAGGNSASAYALAASLGHTIIPPVPSLFTFTMQDKRLEGLAGVSVPSAQLTLCSPSSGSTQIRNQITAEGPLLVTHWGLSGPAVLKLSAWGARFLADCQYSANLQVNWLAPKTPQSIFLSLLENKNSHPLAITCLREPGGKLPSRLWKALCRAVKIDDGLLWGETPRSKLQKLAEELTRGIFYIQDKGVFKDEFVTCGGVKLDEIDFRSMQSRRCPGLFIAGEILNIDGLTGGFNFQAAWTTGWIAGRAIAESLTA